MAGIKRTTLDTLKTRLESISGLSGKVFVAQQGPEKTVTYPSVVIIPQAFTFEPETAEDVWWDAVTDDGKVLQEVGTFDGLLEIQLYTNSAPQREQFEEAILQAFLSTPGAPGTICLNTPTLTVNGLVSLYSAPILYRLDDEDWREEFAFESRRFSFLDVVVSFPALTVRDAYTLDSLRVAITENLDGETPREVYEVQEDGSTEVSS
jgi:hypothetical protein